MQLLKSTYNFRTFFLLFDRDRRRGRHPVSYAVFVMILSLFPPVSSFMPIGNQPAFSSPAFRTSGGRIETHFFRLLLFMGGKFKFLITLNTCQGFRWHSTTPVCNYFIHSKTKLSQQCLCHDNKYLNLIIIYYLRMISIGTFDSDISEMPARENQKRSARSLGRLKKDRSGVESDEKGLSRASA